MNNGYEIYLHYKLIIELLKEEKSAYELVELTAIHQGTVYRILKTLVEQNIITQTGYRLPSKNSRKVERLFKIKELEE